MTVNHFVNCWLGTALAIAAAGYACVALWAWLRSRRAATGTAAGLCAVSVLKPLHGAEPRLYENLRSFCVQAYPAAFQLVFGIREADDPAIAVVERLRREFPHLAIELVVDPRTHGANLKVSNLINMLPSARHDWLVLADSDIGVAPDYLTRVAAPLADPGVGLVTCLYYGVPQRNIWSRLGRLFIDDWFAPSVRLAHAFGSTRFAFGSTIALRRASLDAIGGFEILRDTLADDFWLGEAIRRNGLRTVLSEMVVGTDVGETSLRDLWTHELRWLRTIRSLSPAGFAMSFVCFTWPVLLLALLLAPTPAVAWLAAVAGTARIVRYLLQQQANPLRAPWYEILLTPCRDGLLLLEWAAALTSWKVQWRGRALHARDGGPLMKPRSMQRSRHEAQDRPRT